MTTAWLIAGGLVLLVAFAVLVGTSMDTERQRRAASRVATERRLLRAEQRAWREWQTAAADDDAEHRQPWEHQ